LEKSRIAAPEDVTTTRLTDGALFLTALRRPTVPLIAEEQSDKQVVFQVDFWEILGTNLDPGYPS
jgi:threonine/homoserine efflux transporter RhtA